MNNKVIFTVGATAVMLFGYYQFSSSNEEVLLDDDIEIVFEDTIDQEETDKPIKQLVASTSLESTKKIVKSEKQTVKRTPKIELTDQQLQVREQLTENLLELDNCKQTFTCPEDKSDPRASAHLLGQQIAEKLRDYVKLHEETGYFDEEAVNITRRFIAHPNGYVQEEAIKFMSMQPANEDTAIVLLETLSEGYDAKIMVQGMGELQRYPELQDQTDNVFIQTLKHGPLTVSKELAKNIKPFINSTNINKYKAVQKSLPANSAKSKNLKAAIIEAEHKM